MPYAKLGGYAFREIMAWLAVGESDDIDAIQEAIEMLFTEDPVGAAKILREMTHNMKLRMKMHTLLQANDLDEAQKILNQQIKPALNSGKKD